MSRSFTVYMILLGSAVRKLNSSFHVLRKLDKLDWIFLCVCVFFFFNISMLSYCLQNQQCVQCVSHESLLWNSLFIRFLISNGWGSDADRNLIFDYLRLLITAKDLLLRCQQQHDAGLTLLTLKVTPASWKVNRGQPNSLKWRAYFLAV